MMYKQVVCEVAATADKQGRKPVLAVLYDEVMRKHWEDMTGEQCFSSVQEVVAP